MAPSKKKPIDESVKKPPAKKKAKPPKKDELRVTGDFNLIAVDPSLSCPGFALMEYHSDTRSVKVVKVTSVDNSKSKQKSHGSILLDIYNEFVKYVPNTNPLTVASTHAFVRERGYTNFSTHYLAKVLGVLDLTLALSNRTMTFYEIPPATVKKLVGGSGKATKEQVAEALPKYVGNIEYKTDDESDAVAVGIAWLIRNGLMDTKGNDG